MKPLLLFFVYKGLIMDLLKMKKFVLYIFIALVTVACTTPNIEIPGGLKNTSPMEVKGRQGWQFNQVIKYGNYSTSKVKRGWTTKYNFSFIVHFQGAKEKLSFTQITPEGSVGEVFAISKFKSQDIDILKSYISAPIEYENSFAGTIVPNNNKDNTWEFVIYNPEGEISNNSLCGFIRSLDGRNIDIRAIRKIEGQANWLQFANYGFEFREEGKSLAAVSTLNKGRIWIKEDLTPETKLIVSSVATSILLRNSMID